MVNLFLGKGANSLLLNCDGESVHDFEDISPEVRELLDASAPTSTLRSTEDCAIQSENYTSIETIKKRVID